MVRCPFFFWFLLLRAFKTSSLSFWGLNTLCLHTVFFLGRGSAYSIWCPLSTLNLMSGTCRESGEILSQAFLNIAFSFLSSNRHPHTHTHRFCVCSMFRGYCSLCFVFHISPSLLFSVGKLCWLSLKLRSLSLAISSPLLIKHALNFHHGVFDL